MTGQIYNFNISEQDIETIFNIKIDKLMQDLRIWQPSCLCKQICKSGLHGSVTWIKLLAAYYGNKCDEYRLCQDPAGIPTLIIITYATRDSMPHVDPVIKALVEADHLSEETRIGYSKRLALIAAAAGNRELLLVLALHAQKVLNWIFGSYKEVGTQRTMIVAILAAYKLLDLKTTEKSSYGLYLEHYERLDKVLRDRAKDNVPTKRQRAGFVSYTDLQKVRKKLEVGSKERLLLSFYGGCIPPLRNDLHACAVQLLNCDDDEVAKLALLHQVTPNEILLSCDRSTPGILILREFKTQDRIHQVLYIRSLGQKLTKELKTSLQKNPRHYLFTESSSGRPYTHSGFAMYARRTLQRLFGKPCTLTLLRHSYISHMLAYGQLSIRSVSSWQLKCVIHLQHKHRS